MATAYLIHGAGNEAEKGVEALKTAGYEVCCGPLNETTLKILGVSSHH